MLPPRATCTGVLIGFCAWTLPLAPMLVLAAGPAALWTHFAPALCLSLGLGLAFLALLQVSQQLPARVRARIRVGVLLWMVGLLLFAAQQELPVLLGSATVRNVLVRTGSVTEVPAWLPPLLMIVGLLLGLCGRRHGSGP